MANTKTGYKIVRWTDDGKLLSCVVSRADNFDVKSVTEGCIEYRKGEWAEPKEGWGPLALFDTLEDARDFRFNWGWQVPTDGWEIWKCEYVPSKASKMWALIQMEAEYQMVKDWSPYGTRLASKICLVEKIEECD